MSKLEYTSDLFGEALYGYNQGDRSDFYICEPNGDKYNHSLNRYFRTKNQFSNLELSLFARCNGKILDVGCSTGYYLGHMGKRDDVLGIDISTKALEIGKMIGVTNNRRLHIFENNLESQFDSITLLESNIGLGGSVEKTILLLT